MNDFWFGNDIDFETNFAQGDTVLVIHDFKAGPEDYGSGIIHIPPNNKLPMLVFMDNFDHTEGEPRKYFVEFPETWSELKLKITRIVLVEKNIYKCLHGGNSINELWPT